MKQLAQALKNLVYLGNYPLRSEIKTFLFDENSDFSEDVLFTFEEMMKIADNKIVNKNGKTYSIKDFNIEEIDFSDTELRSLDNVNIEAVKYIDRRQNEMKYIFKVENEIYQVSVPSDLEYWDEVNEFIQNVKLEK